MIALRLVRKQIGLSMTQLSRASRIDLAALSKIERGIWPCGPAWRKRIATVLEKSEGELFREVTPSDHSKG